MGAGRRVMARRATRAEISGEGEGAAVGARPATVSKGAALLRVAATAVPSRTDVPWSAALAAFARRLRRKHRSVRESGEVAETHE